MKEDLKELKVICPFCNSIQPAEIEEALYATGGCETCGPGDPEGDIKIKCGKCEKVIYTKEIG